MTIKNPPHALNGWRTALPGTVAIAAILAAVPYTAVSTMLADPDGTGTSRIFPYLTTTPVSTSQISVGFCGIRDEVEVNSSSAGFGNIQVRVLNGTKVEAIDIDNASIQPQPVGSLGVYAIDGNTELTVDGVSSGGTTSSVTTAGDINIGAPRGFTGFTAAGEPRYSFAGPNAAGDHMTDLRGNALFHGDGTPVHAEAQVFGAFMVLGPEQQQRDVRISAPGHLDVLNGTVVQSSNDVIISPMAEPGLTLQAPFGGSSSSVTVASGHTLQAHNVIVNPLGLLTGNGGTIMENVILNNGTIAPESSFGTMLIEDNLNILTGLLETELGGAIAGLFDQLIVTGDLTSITDLNLKISFINGYIPTEGASFAFLDILGELLGA